MQITRNFNREEFACKCGCGFDVVDYELVILLQQLRDFLKQPIKITSGCRCSNYNFISGGSEKSQHMFGKAADIQVESWDYNYLYDTIEIFTKDKYGIGVYDSWLHIDVRDTMARW